MCRRKASTGSAGSANIGTVDFADDQLTMIRPCDRSQEIYSGLLLLSLTFLLGLYSSIPRAPSYLSCLARLSSGTAGHTEEARTASTHRERTEGGRGRIHLAPRGATWWPGQWLRSRAHSPTHCAVAHANVEAHAALVRAGD